jgi:hypothetical protein
MKKSAFLLVIPLLFSSCNSPRLNFDKGIIPPVPVNFSAVNSSRDDYNSDLKISWADMTFSLIFSSNRNSNGDNFDFIGYHGNIIFDLIDGGFEMQAKAWESGFLEAVNSDCNELGPYFISDYSYFHYYKKGEEERRFFYSSDPEGNLDIFCCRYEFANDGFDPSGDPFEVTQLNTEFNEGYFSLHHGAAQSSETAYFMSDRDGSFDIFSATGEEGKLISESAAVTITRSSVLSSSADDKCPYIAGNVMVFTSDREGGFGGFDLWYSVYNGQAWTEPVNMGNLINTEYDEYRPILVPGGESFINDLMVFSSNRPGGKGGFDLYWVGVPRR